MQVTDNKEIVC